MYARSKQLITKVRYGMSLMIQRDAYMTDTYKNGKKDFGCSLYYRNASWIGIVQCWDLAAFNQSFESP